MTKKQKQSNQQMKQKSKKVRAPQQGGGTTLSKLGSAVGGIFGGPMGSAVGNAAGSLLSRITGWGAYKVNQNSVAAGSSIPSFRLDGDGVRICHREFLTDIQGAVAFTLNALDVNPGLNTTFPWLSQVAYNFETYRFNGLVFEYIPSSGTAVSASSSALGKVVFATSYDAGNANFVTKQQMESYEYSSACVPFERMLHPVECMPGSNPLAVQYVRVGNVPTGQDQRMFDLGNFQYAVQGMQSAYTVGELWVSYDISLMRPRLDTTQYGYTHITENPAATATAAAPLGTSGGVLSSGSNLSGVTSGSTTKFVLQQPGTYIVSANWYTANANIGAAPILTAGSNISLVNTLVDNVSSGYAAFITTESMNTAIFTVTTFGSGAANTITITGNTSMTGATCDILITGVPYSLTKI